MKRLPMIRWSTPSFVNSADQAAGADEVRLPVEQEHYTNGEWRSMEESKISREERALVQAMVTLQIDMQSFGMVTWNHRKGKSDDIAGAVLHHDPG